MLRGSRPTFVTYFVLQSFASACAYLVLAGVTVSCKSRTIRESVDTVTGMAGATSNGGTGTASESAASASSGGSGAASSVGGLGAESTSGGAGGESATTSDESSATVGGVAGADADSSGGTLGSGGVTSTAGGSGGTGAVASTSDGGGGSGSAALCPATHECVPRPPDGWQGPVIYGAASTLSCAGNYPDEALAGGLDVAGGTTCTCECDAAPTSASCTLQVTEYSFSSNCTGSGSTRDLNSASICQGFTSNPSAGLILDGPSAACALGAYGDLPSAAFQDAVRACEGAAELADACASVGDVCLPRPPTALGQGLCIFGSGLLSCPEEYPNETALVFTGLDDTRSCPASCSCAASGGECAATVGVYPVFDCTGGSESVGVGIMSQTCLTEGGGLIPLGVSVSQQPVCSAQTLTSDATGQVAGTDPVTVCCRD